MKMNYDERIKILKEFLTQLTNLENNMDKTSNRINDMKNADYWKNTLAKGAADAMYGRTSHKASALNIEYINFTEAVRTQIKKIKQLKDDEIMSYNRHTAVTTQQEYDEKYIIISNAPIDESSKKVLLQRLKGNFSYLATGY